MTLTASDIKGLVILTADNFNTLNLALSTIKTLIHESELQLSRSDYVDIVMQTSHLIETNLHPKQQIEHCRLIAENINNNQTQIVLTMSDFVIREFSNLIMLSFNEYNYNKIYLSEKGYNLEKHPLNIDKVSFYNVILSKNQECKFYKQEIVKEGGMHPEMLNATIDLQNSVYDYLFDLYLKTIGEL